MDMQTLPQKPVYEFVKRLFDIVMSAIGIIITAPIMLAVAVAVRSDGGPALYSQTRVGRNGKTFRILKFRSMCRNADDPAWMEKLWELNEMDGPAFKIRNDPRVTKVGKFIRRTSLDELPQLFNIFIGDMTIVGPRPPLEGEVAYYTEKQKARLLVPQGLTCYWQCSGRNNICFEEWMELDLKYVQERSLLTDLRIILKTIPAVLTGDGAQ